MITGLVRRADSGVDITHTVPEFSQVWNESTQSVWVDLEQPSEEEVREVAKLFRIDDEVVEDCLFGEQRPRIDEYDEYFVLMVYGLLRGEEPSDTEPRKLTVIVGPKWLVTVHIEPVFAVRRVRRQIVKNHARFGLPSVDDLAHRIIDQVVDRYERVANQYDEQLEELEEISLREDADRSLLADISELRRQILELKRLAASQIELLSPIAKGEMNYISEDIGEEFRHVRDHLLKVVERMDTLRELLRGILDNYRANLAMHANDIVRVLTVYAAVVLPLTLIAGVFGMNLPVWPVPQSPLGFWTVIAAMAICGGGLLLYFKRKHWL